MPVHLLVNNFTGGEMSPYLRGRVDLERYGSACQRMENMRPLPYGGAVMRPGLEHIYTTVGPSRLRAFIYSTETSYVLAFSNNLIKIFRNGAYLSGSDVVTTYAASAIFDLQFLQINDVMYITHPNYAPRKLSRVTSTSFTLAEVAFNEPPFRALNSTAITLTPSAILGTGITLTASAALFQAGHVGAYFKLEYFREATAPAISIISTGETAWATVSGDWTFRTDGTWDGTILIERSYDGGTTSDVIASFTRASDGNVDYSSSEESSASLRIRISDYNSGDGTATLTIAAGYVGGIVKVTAVASSTSATADVLVGLNTTSATVRWYEGAWSTYRGFPRCIGIFEERIYYANTASAPQTIWGSRVGDYDDLATGVEDDDGVTYQIGDSQQNPIQWLLGERSLLFATTSAQWTLNGGDSGEPVTPSNVKVQRQPSNIGAEPFQPVSLPGITLFLQRGGRKFRELFYQFVESSYSAQDVTLLSEHITKGGITQFVAASHPDSIAYAVRGDGQLAVMVYERGQANGGAGNLVAWSRYKTQGEFKSVEVIPGQPEDEVWAVVKRTNDGVDAYCIERFRSRASFLDQRADWFFLDCGRTTGSASPLEVDELWKTFIGGEYTAGGTVYRNVIFKVKIAAHGYSTGDVVLIEGTEIDQVNGGRYKAVVIDADNFWLGERLDEWPLATVIDITQSNPAYMQIGGVALSNNQVVFIESPAGGMVEIEETPLAVTFNPSLGYELTVNTTSYTAFSGTATAHVLKTFQFPSSTTSVFTGGAATRTVNTFDLPAFLDGATVKVVGDGSPDAELTAGDAGISGTVTRTTAPQYYTKIHAGLPYSAYLEPNPFETAMQDGASSPRKKRISRVSILFNNSVGAKCGPDASNLEDILFRSTADNMDQAVPAFSGEKEVLPKFDIIGKASVLVVQDDPLNMEVLYMSPKMEFYA